ncbi:MAG TPA: DUF4384 domain-containing protein [Methanosarcinaceae archaeon]|nr:DUF4384 domain-containing protein [Methanosarcinaceae archaeon]
MCSPCLILVWEQDTNMKNFFLLIISGTIIAIIGLFIEYRFFNSDVSASQALRDLGGIISESEQKIKPIQNINPVVSAKPPISVKIQYLYRHGKEFKTLTNNTVLHSGDFYKIVFTPTETSYLYIFQKGSSGNIFRLFPMHSFKGVVVNNNNPTEAKTYYIPAKDKSFFLDEQTGTESLYIIVTKQKDEALETQYQQVLIARQEDKSETINVAQRALEQTINMRDVGGIAEDLTNTKVNWTEAGQQFSTILARLNSCDGCVSTISFQHK